MDLIDDPEKRTNLKKNYHLKSAIPYMRSLQTYI